MAKKPAHKNTLEEGFLPMAEDITPLDNEDLIADILKDFFPEAKPIIRKPKPEPKTPTEPKPETKSDKPHYEGHRARLKQRFLEGGADAIPDYELLEMILFRALPRRDVKPLAKHLLKTFGSFAEVMAAPIHRLREIEGMGESAAIEMKIIEAAAKRFAKSKVRNKEVLASWNAVIEYCRTAMAYELKEQLRLLFLDKRNQLIADEVQQTGTIDHTPVYPREVVKRAIELSASAVILVHNHPSGDPTPSTADIRMTHQIIEIATPLGLEILDHIIIGKNGHASLKALGHM